MEELELGEEKGNGRRVAAFIIFFRMKRGRLRSTRVCGSTYITNEVAGNEGGGFSGLWCLLGC